MAEDRCAKEAMHAGVRGCMRQRLRLEGRDYPHPQTRRQRCERTMAMQPMLISRSHSPGSVSALLARARAPDGSVEKRPRDTTGSLRAIKHLVFS